MRGPFEEMRKFHPSPSFEILLPEEIVHQSDERVSSFWCKGEPLLLQLSSYSKHDGEPIPPQLRLKERVEKNPGEWKPWVGSRFTPEGAQQAIGEILDENRVLWLHAYFVWPHLTVYATISGPENLVRNPNNWAITALKDMKLILQ